MTHIAAAALTLLWVACNFYLWSAKQPPVWLFWQSVAMVAVAFPALYWYVTRPVKLK